MTVLVTGGAGYIGSHTVLELISRSESVVIIDNFSTGYRFLVPESVPVLTGDAGDPSLLSKVFQDYDITAVIHFAGSISVPESVEKPLDYYLNNTVTSRTIIEEVIRRGIKHFIFSSTATLYGMLNRSSLSETDPLNPISPYGTSKMMTELMLQDAARAYDFNHVTLRYFNVAGADPLGRSGQSSPGATHLIKVASKAVLGQIPGVSVFGTDYPTPDGTGIRDYIHVSDLARAHCMALDYLRAGGESEIMNCGYGHGYSVLEVITAMKEVSGVDFQVTTSGRRTGDPAILVADNRKIKKLLSWEPGFNDLHTILQHALEWEKKLAGRN